MKFDLYIITWFSWDWLIGNCNYDPRDIVGYNYVDTLLFKEKISSINKHSDYFDKWYHSI